MQLPNDVAVINVPLSKRGNVDAQLDRYKAQQQIAQKRQASEKAAERRTDKALAKELLAEHLPAILATHGPKFGAKALRDVLDGWAKWEPKKLIAFVEKFTREPAALAGAVS